MFYGNRSRMVIAVAYLCVDIDLCAALADVGIVNEDATACHLLLFDSIGDSYL